MSKSFSDFCREEKVKPDQEENLQNTYDELKDMNYDELTEKLYNEVKKQKDKGAFNFVELQENVERLKPFISQETYNNMINMLEKIK